MKKAMKKYDGRVLTIRAILGSLDEGTIITGRYRHLSRKSSFRFDRLGCDRSSCFDRDDWEVLKVWSASYEQLNPVADKVAETFMFGDCSKEEAGAYERSFGE